MYRKYDASRRFTAYARGCGVLLLGLAFAQASFAIDCGSAGSSIGLTTQAEVDAFQATYGAGGTCDRLVGGLSISGQDITDLTPLQAIREIDSVLGILRNDALTRLDGLSGLVSVGYLIIEENPVLDNLDGLSSLTGIGASLVIRENQALRNLNGLSSLTSVGFSRLEPLCWSIEVRDNPSLLNIDGLSGISRAECDIWIQTNPALENLDGLSGLVSIGGDLAIYENTSLADISGLSGVREVGYAFVGIGIADSLISDVDALSSVEKAGDLALWNNRFLSDCSGVLTLVDTVDDYEPGPGSGPAPDLERVNDFWDLDLVEDNAPGCNSVDEILAVEPISGINAGLTGAWYNPETSGQGMFITVYPRIREVFLSWFTYDVERPDPTVTAILGDPGHRWMTAQGPYPWLDPEIKMSVYGTAVLELWQTEGGVFDQKEPVPAWEPDGTLTLEFDTCSTATVTYDIPSANVSGTIPIERIALDNVRRCYELDRIRWGVPDQPD